MTDEPAADDPTADDPTADEPTEEPPVDEPTDEPPAEPPAGGKAFMVRRTSLRTDVAGSISCNDGIGSFSRRGSTRVQGQGSVARRGGERLTREDPTEPARTGSMRRHSSLLSDMGEMSAREAAAAQEAAEAANEDDEDSPEAVEDDGDDEDGEMEEIGQRRLRMSLLDLLDESGSRYKGGGGDTTEDEHDEDDEEENSDPNAPEHACGVCMVKHRGTPFVPCEHSFCRLCSKELTVQKGNCPLCNGYILEILHIF